METFTVSMNVQYEQSHHNHVASLRMPNMQVSRFWTKYRLTLLNTPNVTLRCRLLCTVYNTHSIKTVHPTTQRQPYGTNKIGNISTKNYIQNYLICQSVNIDQCLFWAEGMTYYIATCQALCISLILSLVVRLLTTGIIESPFHYTYWLLLWFPHHSFFGK